MYLQKMPVVIDIMTVIINHLRSEQVAHQAPEGFVLVRSLGYQLINYTARLDVLAEEMLQAQTLDIAIRLQNTNTANYNVFWSLKRLYLTG